MRKGRDLLGLPVLKSVSGERLGEILDLVYAPGEQLITGFVIDKGNWLRPPRQVLSSSVKRVEAEAVKTEEPQVAELDNFDCLVSSLHGKKVQTVGGKLLGSVQDVVLDDLCSRVTGLEISDGFISDLVSGRAIVPRPDIITQSDHTVIVEDKLEEIWQNHS